MLQAAGIPDNIFRRHQSPDYTTQPLQNHAPFCHVNWDIVLPLIRPIRLWWQ